MVIVNMAKLLKRYTDLSEVLEIVNGFAEADTVTGVPAPRLVFKAYL